jgi:hypothetical protein
VPAKLTEDQRHHRSHSDEHLPHHALPLLGWHQLHTQSSVDGREKDSHGQATRNNALPAGTNRHRLVEANGQHQAQTNRQDPPQTNGHQLVETPPADASSEDGRVNEAQWIGCWPTTAATFPHASHNGHNSAETNDRQPAGTNGQ